MSEALPGGSAEQPGESPPARRASSRRPWWRWLTDAAAVASFILLLAYLHLRVVQVTYVGTGSMEPTIQPGDRLLVQLSAYRNAPPERGDIITFWAKAHNEYEVKRVIGAGGDRLIVGGGVVLRNGRRLQEPYIAAPMIREFPVGGLLADDQLFVMGDNRNESEDSRDFGPIRLRDVRGRVFFRVLPLGRAGPVR